MSEVLNLDNHQPSNCFTFNSASPYNAKLPYAGSFHPRQAWHLIQNGLAILIDVRTLEELTFVGSVPNSIHIPWAIGTHLTRNPRFVKELERKFSKHQTLLFICRSGKRSAQAAEAATKAGFTQVFNVAQGFEGDLDENQQRGQLGGWRFHHLPWQQN
ncbi:MAG: rhodanese-like domain-containing protein [Thiofilum sp.]|uniref:rhodanese-like domain-containing protein n=1 Tax=Thiofilum sp. TaxID=2212733 RepID=UPI0026009746|nr:rhodanese-like domain-containing protein [Thiofilum sp.]MBK8454157.1 rhodanese-like domain-containing protein [Thiofilum sp.]